VGAGGLLRVQLGRRQPQLLNSLKGFERKVLPQTADDLNDFNAFNDFVATSPYVKRIVLRVIRTESSEGLESHNSTIA
jgi:hypothetical protein